MDCHNTPSWIFFRIKKVLCGLQLGMVYANSMGTNVTYRLSPDINPEGKSNRFDQISEDQYNNIWVLSYDDQAYLFNPQTELFTGVRSLEYYNNSLFIRPKFYTQKAGKHG
jgi:hypothetical protein